jgi:hypothetical protein
LILQNYPSKLKKYKKIPRFKLKVKKIIKLQIILKISRIKILKAWKYRLKKQKHLDKLKHRLEVENQKLRTLKLS